MTRRDLILIILLFTSTFAFAQNCDCKSNYEWVKKTFEQNDAGFQYVLETKGQQAYEDHNTRILGKVKAANSLTECTSILTRIIH
ncbi:hypothetical protein LVD15_22585 [Fulvivirga maritima]|uniref:hypothetical protein n=1 Tax=Fulvivirga maritima TaxID=2904247 RepID=UPI001F30C82F|nr:hypothetical protein [Fulvivirga maritima]UII26063.1 hypothetical protein LVD15_22585 [Fulvivirga maritima]